MAIELRFFHPDLTSPYGKILPSVLGLNQSRCISTRGLSFRLYHRWGISPRPETDLHLFNCKPKYFFEQKTYSSIVVLSSSSSKSNSRSSSQLGQLIEPSSSIASFRHTVSPHVGHVTSYKSSSSKSSSSSSYSSS